MKKLLSILMLLVAIVTGASAADVITFAGATTKDSKTTALQPTISSSNSSITLGTCASTCSTEGYIVTTTDGKTTVLGTTTYYLSQPYQGNSKKYWKDAGASFYGTFTIPSGYTYVMKGINHALVANGSSNFTATISVKDATTTKYATSTISVAKKDDGATITSTTISLEEANWVTLSAGTYTINVVPSNSDSSTGKYFGIAQVSITGDLAVAGPSLSVTPPTANAFTYVAGNGPSAAQEFTVNLSNSEKAVSATLNSENYEMSKTSDGTYASTAITDLENGSKVYVRLKAGLEKADDYNGTLTFANDDVTADVVVNLSGSVTGQTYTVDYELNGGSGDAPTQDPVEAGTQITLPAAASRDFYTFNGWLCDADNVVYDAETLYEMTATPTTFTAQWTGPSYSSTLDFAANSAAAPAIAEFLASGNMISDVTGEWEALTAGKEGYGGFKVKKNNASLKFLAQAGKHVTITLGSINHAVTLKKNGTTAGSISASTGNTKMAIVAFDAGEEDVLVELVTSDNKTVTLIKIAIEDALASTPVTVGETGFATIGLPYATTIPENVTAYSVSATSATAVTLSSAIAAGTTIPANKGFIIVATPGDYTFNQFANDTWQGDVANKLEATGASAKVAAAEGEFYYFAIIDSTHKKVGFKKCAANASLAANKAYLPGAGLNANSLSLSFDDATAIKGIAETEADAEAPVKVVKNGQLFIGNYNVAGARIK